MELRKKTFSYVFFKNCIFLFFIFSLVACKEKPPTPVNIQPIESLRAPNTPLANKVGLDEAIKNGLIRRLTQEEFDQWYEQETLPRSYWHSMSADSNGSKKIRLPIYIVLKPFQVPAGLHGVDAVIFILPEGVPMPSGSWGHARLFDVSKKGSLPFSMGK